jgi:phosphatidate cytidylyltransferase
MARLAEFLQIETPVVLTLAAVVASLAFGSLVRIAWSRRLSRADRDQRIASLKTWWLLFLLFSISVLAGRGFVLLLFAVASWLALREYLDLVLPEREERCRWHLLYGLSILHYVCVYWGNLPLVLSLLPVGMMVLLGVCRIPAGEPRGFIREVSGVYWGTMLVVVCLSHAPLLLALPAASNPTGGTQGWLVYVVLLTEFSDISQALWGRVLGRHQITLVSPHKTWEGLALGFLTTLVLSVVLGHWITPLTSGSPEIARGARFLPPMAAGTIIFAAGFLGDITLSAVKRDAGVKDSSGMLPGQGGILDRVDSLTLAAPAFFYFVYWLYV